MARRSAGAKGDRPAGGGRVGRLLGLTAVAFLFAAAGYAGWSWAQLPTITEIARLARENPGPTAMMRARGQKGARQQVWTPLARVDPLLVRAVLASEDASFWTHDGFDPREIGNALAEAAQGKKARGASTITQQLARNLWLGDERSLARKLKEAILAVRLEEALAKGRILELYLNVAEWGEQAWGVEAAAREHFGHSAAALAPWEAAALAAMLPSPRRLALAKKNPELLRRTERVLRFLVQRKDLTQAQADLAREELRRRLSTRASAQAP